MKTITDLVLPILGGLDANLIDSIKKLTKIDLTPAAFKAAFNASDLTAFAAQFSAYIGAETTWAKVVENNSVETGDGVEYVKVFTGVDTKDKFIDVILTMLTPLEPILSFLLTGGELSIYEKLAEAARTQYARLDANAKDCYRELILFPVEAMANLQIGRAHV